MLYTFNKRVEYVSDNENSNVTALFYLNAAEHR